MSGMDHRRHPSALELAAGALLASTVVLHVVAMFPNYFAGDSPQSIASQADQVALYGVVAGVWALALGFGLSSPARVRAAAGIAIGAAAAEAGFRLSDLGEVFRYGTSQAGAGMWLMVAAWFVGAAGAIVAAIAVRRSTRAGHAPAGVPAERPPVPRAAAVVGVAVLSLATAGLFLPAWDHYEGASTVTGRGFSFNLGDAFALPWQVVTGNVLSAVAIALVPILAALWIWRDRHLSAGATAGVLGMLAAQFVAAVAQVDQAVPPSIAGISPAQANQLGLTIGLKLTGWFLGDVLLAFALFTLTMALATARPVQENSAAALASAPDARSAATSAWS
ncbi:MAG TPA: hypothetical protein VNF71_12290 [Acidimicrobiales bacterium]|nr:hypothetical protein [Acidimicrobiales bacterium]